MSVSVGSGAGLSRRLGLIGGVLMVILWGSAPASAQVEAQGEAAAEGGAQVEKKRAQKKKKKKKKKRKKKKRQHVEGQTATTEAEDAKEGEGMPVGEPEDPTGAGAGVAKGVGAVEAVAGAGAAEAVAGAGAAEAVAGAGAAERRVIAEDFGGRLEVLQPEGKDWGCDSRKAQQQGSMVSMITCRSTQAGQFFFMTAKWYTVPAEQVLKSEALAKEYVGHYDKMFREIEVVREGEANLRGHAAYEIELKMSHAKMGKIRKRERFAAVGRGVLLLSAEGREDSYEAMEAAITAWFEHSQLQLPPGIE